MEKSGNFRKMLHIRGKVREFDLPKTKRKYMPVWCLYFHCNKSSLQPRGPFELETSRNYSHGISKNLSWKSQGKIREFYFHEMLGTLSIFPSTVSCGSQSSARSFPSVVLSRGSMTGN